MVNSIPRAHQTLGEPFEFGLNPIAHQFKIFWANETPPKNAIWSTLSQAFVELCNKNGAEAYGLLTSLASDCFDLEAPSSVSMRYSYWLGLARYLMAGPTKGQKSYALYREAADFMRRAWSIARDGNDIPSLVTIARMIGEAEHNAMGYDQARSEFQMALTTLLCYPLADLLMQTRVEIFLRSRLARQQFMLGEFTNALDNIERARQLRRPIAGPVMSDRDRAFEEWMEALVIRGQSDACGSDLPLLRDAMRLFKRAEGRLSDPQLRMSLLRLMIQIAETHLDIADCYRRLGKPQTFKYNMAQADIYAFKVAAELDPSDDSGQDMVKMTILRHELLSYDPAQLAALSAAIRSGDYGDKDSEMRFVAPQLYEIEVKALAKENYLIAARAMTLRADYLYAGRSNYAALYVYYAALEMFERAGARGESGRARLGVRRILDLV